MNYSYLFYRITAAIFIASIIVSVIYIFIIPKFAAEQKTLLYLAIGLLFVFLYSALEIYLNIDTRQPWRAIASIVIGIMCSIFTLIISLFFILNTRGS